MKTFWIMAMLLCFGFAMSGAEPQTGTTLGKMATLVGTWSGTQTMGMEKDKKMEPFTVTCKLTAGGSALVETLMPGTPHEMVTLYTRDKGDFVATHYCMLRNQPRMRAKDTLADKKLMFDFVDATGFATPEDPHMHSLMFEFTDDNHMAQTWTHWAGGKETNKVVFELIRTP